MQRAGISFPIEFHGREFEFDIDIVRLDSQRAVQDRFLLGETAQMTITERNLLQRKAVARIEINGALQAPHRLFLFALTTLECNPSARKHWHYWARSWQRFPIRPERRHNRGSLDKGFGRVRGVLHPHLDGGEMPPQLPLQLMPAGQVYGRHRRNKAGRES